VGVENNTGRNFKDLEEMRGNAKALKRNNRECKGILIGPLKAPRFFESVKFLRRGFFTHCLSQIVGFGPKSCGTDGKPTKEAQGQWTSGRSMDMIAPTFVLTSIGS
jgi:hypothetical protein